MKKIPVLLILCISIAGMLIGCNNKKNDVNNETNPTPKVTNDDDTNEEDDIEGTFTPIENPVVKEDYDYNDYIKLGKYKGIEVKVEHLEVTDEDIDFTIQMDLRDNAVTLTEVTDRAVKNGDTVIMDFAGYHNGEPFEGETAEGYELTVGSGVFIDGFEQQLVGAEPDKEIDVNVTFPIDYHAAELAGEPVLFKVTVKSIQHYELTEDFVKNIKGFDTKEAYRDSIRSKLEAEYADLMARKKENDVYYAVISGSDITLPDNLLEYYEADFRTVYTNIAAGSGTDLETLLMMYGYSTEDFELSVKSYSQSMATRELIVKAISTIEGIELTEDEFQAEVAQFAEQYGYASSEEFLKKANVDVLKEDMLFNKVMEFLVAESIEI